MASCEGEKDKRPRTEKVYQIWEHTQFTIAGYAVTVFLFEIFTQKFTTCAELDVSWSFNSLNVGMMTCGIFLLLRKVQCHNKIITKIFNDLALKSYGMYLVHIMFLQMWNWVFDAENKQATIFIPVVAILTFICSYIAIKLISYIPYSEYIIGWAMLLYINK